MRQITGGLESEIYFVYFWVRRLVIYQRPADKRIKLFAYVAPDWLKWLNFFGGG